MFLPILIRTSQSCHCPIRPPSMINRGDKTTEMEKRIYNGIPWYDQNTNPVNAHGACIVPAEGKYYLFGEYKTDDLNKYVGFSCYSTENFTDWVFEGLALPPLKEGLLGPERIGERVKVLENKATGKYVMLMHTDDMRYCDPCIGLAVGERIDEEFTFQGPLTYQGEPLRFWDMGTFIDEDGTAYLLTHEGNIYRLDESYTRAVELVAEGIAPGGESPAMFREEGTYYLMFSHKTSWERNDNYYFVAKDLHGPWEYKGLFCPEGSLTYNSQCSYVFRYGDIPVYMGDRWSFPRQASAATLVLLPILAKNREMRIPEYLPVWSPDTLEKTDYGAGHCVAFRSNVRNEAFRIAFAGERIALFGNTDSHGGYGDIEICDEKGGSIFRTSIDFYSAVPDSGLRFLSPALEYGRYTLCISASGANSVCMTKSGTRYGSDDFYVDVTGWSVFGRNAVNRKSMTSISDEGSY